MPPISLPQSSYTVTPPIAVDGMLADTENRQTETMIAAVALAAGRGVVKGTTVDDAKLPTVAADVTNHFMGVALYQAEKMPTGTANQYAAKDAVPVLRKGRVWMFPEGDTVDNGPVFIVNGSGAGTAGKLRGDANTAAATQVTRAIVRKGSTVASGLPSLVEFNLP